MTEVSLIKQPHGTDRGYQRHRRADEEACNPCKNAHREYRRAHRARRGQQRDRAQANAYRAAERRVRLAHPAEFMRYYAEELASIRSERAL